MPGKKTDQLEVRIIKLLEKAESKDGWTELRIVAWAANGREFPPKLEKRQFFNQPNGAPPKIGKIVGLSYADWVLLSKDKNKEKILYALYNSQWPDDLEVSPEPELNQEGMGGEEVPF